ncbi:MAG: fibronectin type III domain-containing protein [Eubacterium sp.]
MNFSSAISKLCAKVGVNCVLVGSSDLNHQWNEIEISGKRYVIDCTFADDGFMITPKEFNELWEKSVYTGSGTTYKTDDCKSKSNYATVKYNFKNKLKQKKQFWKSSKDFDGDITVIPACHGYSISWKNDSKADYYLVRRRIFNKSNKKIADEYLKLVFPGQNGTTVFVDESPSQYTNYRFEYEVVKERFDCVTDVYGTGQYVKPVANYTGSEHQWVYVQTVRVPTSESLGANLFQCLTCQTKMMAYTSNTICSVHDVIPVVYSSEGVVKDTCAKCNAVLGNSRAIINTQYQISDEYKKDADGNRISKSIKKASIKKLTAGKNTFTVDWSKVSGIKGYQIQYSTSKKFTKGKTKSITISKQNAVKKTVKKLNGGKKYYVRIRTYKTVNGKKVYSNWSKVKSVNVKK